MNYIRYHEAEKLIRLYPLMQSTLESLQLNLELLNQQEALDEDIYALCMGKHGEGIIPPKGTVTDITGNVAVAFRRTSKMEARELARDILLLSGIMNNIRIGLNSLLSLQRSVIELYYWGEQKTWTEVVMELKEQGKYVSVSQAKRIREQGIYRFIKAAKITVDAYKNVIEIMEGREHN